jgi:hypothetical protein
VPKDFAKKYLLAPTNSFENGAPYLEIVKGSSGKS